MDDTQPFYLMKNDDGTIFGPIPFSQLRKWAHDAQVSPLDKVSTDASSWVKAPMIPELNMDHIVEVTPDQYYGPTTLGTIREFLDNGEITLDSLVINCTDNTEKRVRDFPEFAPQPKTEQKPVRASIRLSLQQRIRDLEEALLEERRAREAAEALAERLEARLSESGK